MCQVLSVGLFDGIGALRVACDFLGLPVAGHVSVECNRRLPVLWRAFSLKQSSVRTSLQWMLSW